MKQTLDIHHKNQISKIKQARGQVEHIKQRISEIDKHEASFETQNATEAEFQHHIELIDERLELSKKLVELDKTMDETMYLVNTSEILFKYYDLIEKGNKNVLIADHDSYHSPNSILRFFTPTAASHKSANPTQEKSRGSLLESYMSIMDADHINQKVKDGEEICPHCKSPAIVTMVNEGYTYCSVCHTMENMIVDHDKPSYKDPPKEITYFSYKRINHLNEWLNQIQGKETTEIPEEIYDKILFEIKKQRITNMADLSYDKVKRILKQLKVHKYYEHIPHIINRLNGLPMPNFSPDLEEKLRTMFKHIQTPFLKHAPTMRKNFLSYSFCLHKFLQLLEKDEYLSYFCLLKSRDKLQAQDKIWKKICEEVKWQFIPSL